MSGLLLELDSTWVYYFVVVAIVCTSLDVLLCCIVSKERKLCCCDHRLYCIGCVVVLYCIKRKKMSFKFLK